MKSFKKYLVILTIAAGFSFTLLLNSCKKPAPPTCDNCQPTQETGTLLMHLHNFIGQNEVDGYNIAYEDDNGRKISVSISQMYITGVQLIKPDGSLLDVPTGRFLRVFGTETYILGDVPAGNYRSIKFKVGLDAATNGKNPKDSPDSNMLNRPEMWFGVTPQPEGYIFFNVQGSIDSSSDLSEKMAPFVYKIGTNQHYMEVTMPDKNYTVLPGKVEYVHLYADYSLLFTGLDLTKPENLNIKTTADNATQQGQHIANTITGIFRYE